MGIELSFQTIVLDHDLGSLQVFASHHFGLYLRGENDSKRLKEFHLRLSFILERSDRISYLNNLLKKKYHNLPERQCIRFRCLIVIRPYRKGHDLFGLTLSEDTFLDN